MMTMPCLSRASNGGQIEDIKSNDDNVARIFMGLPYDLYSQRKWEDKSVHISPNKVSYTFVTAHYNGHDSLVKILIGHSSCQTLIILFNAEQFSLYQECNIHLSMYSTVVVHIMKLKAQTPPTYANGGTADTNINTLEPPITDPPTSGS